MDELLGAIQQRKLKILELNENIQKIRLKNQLNQTDRQAIYAIIRKMKEEEKNRSEKENWIVSIMRNTKQYSEEQMCHIFIKTNEIMRTINNSFIETPYSPPNHLYQFLEMYYNLYQTFHQTLNQENQLKVSFKQSIKFGNVNLVTDLLKSLLGTSRKFLRNCMEDLAFQVNRDLSPEKQKFIKKLAPDQLIENLRSRSSTQNGKKDGSLIIDNMTNSVIYNDECQRYSEKKEVQQIKDKLKQQKRLIITQKIHSAYDFSPAESPANQLRNKLLQLQAKDFDKTTFTSIYANIVTVMDDLDDQNIAVLDYQTIKRQSQNFEEFKLNYDSLCEKIRTRNQLVQQSVTDYNSYVQRKSNVEAEFIKIIKDKYEELSQPSQFHFCMAIVKPSCDHRCSCQEAHSMSCHQNQSTSTSISSPLKGKIIIRKSVQSIKKQLNIKQNLNTFTTKNLIEQIKKQKVFNQTILYEDQASMELYRFNNQNSPCNNKQNTSGLQIRKLDACNPVQQYKLYAHRLSNETQQPMIKTQSRAQSAHAQNHLKYLTCSGYLDNLNIQQTENAMDARNQTNFPSFIKNGL